MYEHGEPSEGFPMVDLSSEEEEATSDTSWEEEITHKLFGDLNHDLLRPPGDDNVIIISDSKEEEDVREDDDVDAEVAPSSTWNSLLHPPPLLIPMTHPMGCKMIVVMVGPEPICLRLSHQKGCL
jgi:hypothetical protein